MRPHDETGAGTVLALAAIGVVLVLIMAGLQLGSTAVTAHRARSSADLAALAGASALQQGRGSPCAVSDAVARRNGTRLVACTVGRDQSVVVRVVCPLPLTWPGLPDQAEVSARAGPQAQARGSSRRSRVPRVPSV